MPLEILNSSRTGTSEVPKRAPRSDPVVSGYRCFSKCMRPTAYPGKLPDHRPCSVASSLLYVKLRIAIRL
jgi:hypothetical protein